MSKTVQGRDILTTEDQQEIVYGLSNGSNGNNSVLYQINTDAVQTLQSLLHSAGRLIMRKWKFDHITSTRDDLHWLPVSQRIVYKLCTIVYKCLHQSAAQYVQELCVPVMNSVSRHQLRSAARSDLQVPATGTVTYGQRSFQALEQSSNQALTLCTDVDTVL